MEKLRQLFYLSRAEAKLTDSDVRQILQVSQRNNRRKDITGCLLYSGRHFAQVLEGGRAVIDDLLTRIAADPRHSGFVIASDQQVVTRKFPNWSMGILYKTDLEDRLEALLTGDHLSEEGTADLFDQMQPDTVMGAL